MSRQQDAQVAEQVMGLTLDWHHKHQQQLAAEHEEANDGRGIFMACQGCDLRGFGNEVDWPQRCPTPLCEPYTSTAEADYKVLEHARSTWEKPELDHMYFQLMEIWRLRWEALPDTRTRAFNYMQYQPGDYARAALAVRAGAQG